MLAYGSVEFREVASASRKRGGEYLPSEKELSEISAKTAGAVALTWHPHPRRAEWLGRELKLNLELNARQTPRVRTRRAKVDLTSIRSGGVTRRGI